MASSAAAALGRHLLAKAGAAKHAAASAAGGAAKGFGATATVTCLVVPTGVGYGLGSGLGDPGSHPQRLRGSWLRFSDPLGAASAATSSSRGFGSLAAPPQPPGRSDLPSPEAPAPGTKAQEGTEAEARRLTKKLAAARDPEAISALLERQHMRFNGTHVSVALTSLADGRLGSRRRRSSGNQGVNGSVSSTGKKGEERLQGALLRSLEGLLAETVATMDPRSLCNAARAAGRLGIASPELLEHLSDRAVAVAGSFGPRDVPVLLSALSDARHRPRPELLGALDAAAARCAPEMRPRDLAQTALALSRCGALASSPSSTPTSSFSASSSSSSSPSRLRGALHPSPPPQQQQEEEEEERPLPRLLSRKLLELVSTSGGSLLNSFKAIDLAATSCAAAPAAGRGDKDALGVLGFIAKEATGRAGEFGPRELSNIAWAFSAAGLRSDALLDALAEEALGCGAVQRFGPRDLATTAWAYSTLRRRGAGRRLLRELGASDQWQGAAGARPSGAAAVALRDSELSTVLRGYAVARIPAPGLVDAVASEVRRRADRLPPEEIAASLWALVTLRCSSTAQGLLNEVEGLLVEAAEDGTLRPKAIAEAVWACNKQGRDSPRLLRAAGERVVAAPDSFLPWELTAVLRAHESLGYQAPETFKAAAASVLRRGLGCFRPPMLSDTLWAFAQLDHAAPELFEAAGVHYASLGAAGDSEWGPFWTRRLLGAVRVSRSPVPPGLLDAADERISRQLRAGDLTVAYARNHLVPLLVALSHPLSPGLTEALLLPCSDETAAPAPSEPPAPKAAEERGTEGSLQPSFTREQAPRQLVALVHEEGGGESWGRMVPGGGALCLPFSPLLRASAGS